MNSSMERRGKRYMANFGEGQIMVLEALDEVLLGITECLGALLNEMDQDYKAKAVETLKTFEEAKFCFCGCVLETVDTQKVSDTLEHLITMCSKVEKSKNLINVFAKTLREVYEISVDTRKGFLMCNGAVTSMEPFTFRDAAEKESHKNITNEFTKKDGEIKMNKSIEVRNKTRQATFTEEQIIVIEAFDELLSNITNTLGHIINDKDLSYPISSKDAINMFSAEAERSTICSTELIGSVQGVVKLLLGVSGSDKGKQERIECFVTVFGKLHQIAKEVRIGFLHDNNAIVVSKGTTYVCGKTMQGMSDEERLAIINAVPDDEKKSSRTTSEFSRKNVETQPADRSMSLKHTANIRIENGKVLVEEFD